MICLSRLLSRQFFHSVNKHPKTRDCIQAGVTLNNGMVGVLPVHGMPSGIILLIRCLAVSVLFASASLSRPCIYAQQTFNTMSLASVQPRIKLNVYSHECLLSFRIPMPGHTWLRYRANMFPVHSIHFSRSRSHRTTSTYDSRGSRCLFFVYSPTRSISYRVSGALFVYSSKPANSRVPSISCHSFIHSLTLGQIT